MADKILHKFDDGTFISLSHPLSRSIRYTAKEEPKATSTPAVVKKKTVTRYADLPQYEQQRRVMEKNQIKGRYSTGAGVGL